MLHECDGEDIAASLQGVALIVICILSHVENSPCTASKEKPEEGDNSCIYACTATHDEESSLLNHD